MRSIGIVIYLVIGVVVAVVRNYLGDIDGLGGLVNLLLAILLWPLVLVGVDFNIRLGGGGDGGRDNRNGALLLFGLSRALGRGLRVFGH